MLVNYEIVDAHFPKCPIIYSDEGHRVLIDTGAQTCLWGTSLDYVVDDNKHEYLGESAKKLFGVGGTNQTYVFRSTIYIKNRAFICEFDYIPGFSKIGVDIILGMSLFQNRSIDISFSRDIITLDVRDVMYEIGFQHEIKKKIEPEDIVIGRYLLNEHTHKIQKLSKVY